jgi:hypothetical protein
MERCFLETKLIKERKKKMNGFCLRRVMLVVVLGIGICGIAGAQIPTSIIIQGNLTDLAGNPLAGSRPWRVQFYNTETGGGALGAPLSGMLTVSSTGRWSVSLTPPEEVLSPTGMVWYELAIDSSPTPDGSIDVADVFPNRTRMESVIFARSVATERIILDTPKIYHVSPGGSDVTGDGSSGSPWATRAHAWDVLSQIDLNGKAVTIKLADGTYSDSLLAQGGLSGQTGGIGQIIFRGNPASPANVVIRPSSGPAFKAEFGGQYSIRDLKMDMAIGQADALFIGQNSNISIGNVIFGANVNPYNDINVGFTGGFYVDGDYTIDGTDNGVSTTASFNGGSTVITVANSSGIVPFMGVGGAGIAAGAHVSAVNGSNITISMPTTSAGVNVSVVFSYGGRSHLNMFNGSQGYYNTNGDPNYTKRVTILGNPFYYAGFVYLNDLSSINIQAITFSGGFSGPAFVVRGNSSLDTEFQGVPYFPNDLYAATTANIQSGSNTITVASSAGIAVGMAVNGCFTPTASFGAGVTSISVSSGSFIQPGNKIKGPGIVAGTNITGVSGSTLNLSHPTDSAQNGVTLWITQYNSTGVAAGTYVTAVNGNTITLSQPAFATTNGLPVWFAGSVQSGGQYM